uniref:Uncharacterized protein n=1 Tax=Hyaloperonospora arabidopsidis (strain Emoy2) TaxID=559515 RepID=M4BF44_HYAAE
MFNASPSKHHLLKILPPLSCTSSKQLHIISAFESCSAIPRITQTQNHCVCVRKSSCVMNTPLLIEFSVSIVKALGH